MHRLFFQRRRISLIACLAMLLNIWAPALGKTIDVLLLDPLVMEICSASGSKQIPVAGHAMKHCALCASLSGSGAAAPPPQLPLLSLLTTTGPGWPLPQYRTPQPSSTWPAARPRAPPSYS